MFNPVFTRISLKEREFLFHSANETYVWNGAYTHKYHKITACGAIHNYVNQGQANESLILLSLLVYYTYYGSAELCSLIILEIRTMSHDAESVYSWIHCIAFQIFHLGDKWMRNVWVWGHLVIMQWNFIEILIVRVSVRTYDSPLLCLLYRPIIVFPLLIYSF